MPTTGNYTPMAPSPVVSAAAAAVRPAGPAAWLHSAQLASWEPWAGTASVVADDSGLHPHLGVKSWCIFRANGSAATAAPRTAVLALQRRHRQQQGGAAARLPGTEGRGARQAWCRSQCQFLGRHGLARRDPRARAAGSALARAHDVALGDGADSTYGHGRAAAHELRACSWQVRRRWRQCYSEPYLVPGSTFTTGDFAHGCFSPSRSAAAGGDSGTMGLGQRGQRTAVGLVVSISTLAISSAIQPSMRRRRRRISTGGAAGGSARRKQQQPRHRQPLRQFIDGRQLGTACCRCRASAAARRQLGRVLSTLRRSGPWAGTSPAAGH